MTRRRRRAKTSASASASASVGRGKSLGLLFGRVVTRSFSHAPRRTDFGQTASEY